MRCSRNLGNGRGWTPKSRRPLRPRRNHHSQLPFTTTAAPTAASMYQGIRWKALVHGTCLFFSPRPSARRRQRRFPAFPRHQLRDDSDPARRLKSVTLRLDGVLGTYLDVWSSSMARASAAARSRAKVRRRRRHIFSLAPPPPHTPLGSQETTYVVSRALSSLH